MLPSSNLIQKIVAGESLLVKELMDIINNRSKKAIEEQGHFYIGLSGGSMAKVVCQGLPSIDTDWSKWKLFFCDERLVPVDHVESTLRIYLEGLCVNTPLTKQQFVCVDTSLDVISAARAYEKEIRTLFPNDEWPVFDLLLLGMGPDGHTASLFPGHPLLEEKSKWIAPINDSPKPPPTRVTMTLPVINHSRACVFAVLGEGKASMVKRILVEKEDLPCTRVKPEGGDLYWLLDEAAASLL